MNLLYRNIRISLGNLNLKNTRQSCTISILDVRNSFIRTRFTVKSKERKSALFNGQYVTLYWKLKYFVVNIWILITHVINNIFL